MASIGALHASIVRQLVAAGQGSPYKADANEPDPRYKSYGVRAAGKAAVIKAHRAEIKALADDAKLTLARKLIESGYGEQQSVGQYVLEQMPHYFGADNIALIDGFVRELFGWSKIDSFAGSLLQPLLYRCPDEMIALARRWNRAADLWLRRASVVLFTRNVAESGRFNDVALALCDDLVHDPEAMVRKGVGWALKDLMRSDQKRVIAYVKSLRAAGVSSEITLYAIRDLSATQRRSILAVKPSRPSSVPP